jgi:alpha-L-rhamnosidase
MKSCYPLLFLFLLSFASCTKQPASLTPDYLRCEYLVNPSGIEVAHPRLSWELASTERDQGQSAYQIIVSTDSSALLSGRGEVWDSGKVKSDQTNMVRYEGAVLGTDTKYFWKVKSWDLEGRESDWSPVASWTMGLLDRNDWEAEWIGPPREDVPFGKRYNYHSGFHSDFSTDPLSEKWVRIDLGKEEAITEIKLFPTDYQDNQNGYLFPVRFVLEGASQDDFSDARVLADESTTDFVQKGLTPYTKNFEPVKARHLRVRVSKSPLADSTRYAFSLGELEVYNTAKENVALKKQVTASDTWLILPYFSYGNWLPNRLNDGFQRPHHAHVPYSLPIPPSPLMRKTFQSDKKIARATLHTTALGIYEVYLNGKKVGKQVLAPEWTDYHKRVQYQSYDVTHQIQMGENVIGAILSDGWYAGALFAHPERGSYDFNRKLLARLALTYEDGSTAKITSDGTWKIFENGPIQSASLFNGEIYDARLEQKNWASPGFDDSKWQNVFVDQDVQLELSAQVNEPIEVLEDITPIAITPAGKGTYIVDLGQNIAGWVRLQLPYNPGRTITLRHGEVLDEDGSLYVTNLRWAKPVDQYIPGNEATISYEPRFTYHGFRYVEISGLTRAPEVSQITGRVVASASPVTGSFSSSNPALNKLWSNILWTQRGNMHSTPTDCPQRDERAGWMGDAQVFTQTAIYNMDMGAFFTKWIRDIRDSQTPDGRFPDYAPHVAVWGNFYNSPGWGDAGVITPWRMYENYGDTAILASHYPAMKAFVASISSRNPDNVWRHARGNMYGDWLNGNTIKADDYPKEGGKVPDDVYSTAFYAYSTQLVAKVAKLLNQTEDAAYYEGLAADIRKAFNQEFVKEDATINGNTQAGYALALEFDLLPETLREKAAKHMVEAVRYYDNRISTGIQTTIRMMNQLNAYGYTDVAYQLIESHRFPSWLYSVDQGATTIWERWDGYVKGRGFQSPNMNSFNHYAIGAVGEWMYRTILGIKPDQPGYKEFIIHPQPGGSLTWAKGSYRSIAGTIGVSWKKEQENFFLDVEVPVNTRATVVLPAGGVLTEGGNDLKKAVGVKVISSDERETRLSVSSGNYQFAVTR